MAAQTWTTLQETVALALTRQQGSTLTAYDPIFVQQFPQATSYAENRIYREIPMLGAREVVSSLSTTAGTRTIDISALSPPMLVVEEVSLITPISTVPSEGTRVRFNLATLDFINVVWPQESVTAAPTAANPFNKYWTLLDATHVVIAPTPDQTGYAVELTGLVQPAPISSGNPTTYLSINYPELLEAGCCIFLSGALNRNFGAQGDEPQQAVSWESQFQTLLAAAKREERRRRGLEPDAPAPPPVPMQPMPPQAQ